MPNVVVDRARCKGCERCVIACPQKVLAMSNEFNEKGYFFAIADNQPRCFGCKLCAITCPDVAIEVRVHGTEFQFFNY